MPVLPAAPAIVFFFAFAAAGRLLSANAKGRVFQRPRQLGGAASMHYC
jgi:hypothetical protein